MTYPSTGKDHLRFRSSELSKMHLETSWLDGRRLFWSLCWRRGVGCAIWLSEEKHQIVLAVVFSWPLRKIYELITTVQCSKR